MKIGILGDKEIILPFRTLGVEVFEIKDEKSFAQAKKTIEEGNFGAIFITQNIKEKFEKEIESFYKKPLPAVLIIPTVQPFEKKKRKELEKIIEQALGSKIIEI